MSNIFKLYILISLPFLVTNCENEGPGKRDWPGIITHDVSGISSSGAVFNGEVISRGEFNVVSYGFVWSENQNPSLNNSDRVIIPGNLASGKFSAEISTSLKPGKKYRVKSFVKTTGYTVYGEEVIFSSLGSMAPIITSFTPAIGKWGDTLRISGSHFSYLSQNNVILFGTIPAKTISSTDSMIVTTVPLIANSEVAEISVSIFGNKATAPIPFSYLKPRITGISPQSGTFDDIITINGIYFSPVVENIIVKFDKPQAELINMSGTSLTVKVPKDISQKNNPVTVSVNKLLSNSDISFEIQPPSVFSLQTNTGYTGNELAIMGNNFNPMASGDSVFFNGNPAVIKSATKNMIVAKVPAGIYATRSCHVEISVVGLKTTCPEIYTLKDPWIRKADVPHKNYTRYGATAFSINGFGYAGLGYNFAGSNFWKYDPQANKWSEIAPFPGSNRMRAAGFVIRNMAYVGLGGTNLHDFWRYDPEINIWTRISDFPADNTGNVSLSLNNKGYVITSEATSNFWEYDAVTDTWTKKKDFPRSTSVYPFYPDAGFCINGKIYIYATDRSTGSDQLWEYDFSTDSWTRKADLTDSYLDIYTTGYSLNGKGYIRGNYYLFEYDPLLNSWSTVPQNKDVPGLFNFRKQSIAFLIGNLLYFGTSSDGWGTGDYLYDFWEFDSNYK